ncbi:glycosyltransferase family 9 protein [bacterium SCSIO 12741]|nr:glycosyltransferase family 9 protein [bacterium SCSIO 12741]
MPKILIIRFSSIGDIVLTTPVIRAAKKQIENAEVHLLTKKAFLPVVEANPYLDKIHVINSKVSEVMPDLKKENFDFVADLHNNLRSSRVKRGLRVESASFPKLNWEKWLLVNFKKNRMPDLHIVERYIYTLARFGVTADGEGLDYFIPDEEKVDLKKALPDSFQKGYLAWVIGGSYYTKMMPVDKVLSIARKIKQPIVLLGGPEDRENGKEIRMRMGDQVYNACGEFSINASASLVEQASAVITNDTGLMHVAAAFNRPVLSVWGNTTPDLGMYPYMPGKEGLSKIMQIEDLSCRPCSKLGHKKCPKKHFYCMRLLDEDVIAEWANQAF